jgi:hypothetical protein
MGGISPERLEELIASRLILRRARSRAVDTGEPLLVDGDGRSRDRVALREDLSELRRPSVVLRERLDLTKEPDALDAFRERGPDEMYEALVRDADIANARQTARLAEPLVDRDETPPLIDPSPDARLVARLKVDVGRPLVGIRDHLREREAVKRPDEELTETSLPARET